MNKKDFGHEMKEVAQIMVGIIHLTKKLETRVNKIMDDRYKEIEDSTNTKQGE